MIAVELEHGQFALGTVAYRQRAFPALLLPGERVFDLTRAGCESVAALLVDWDPALALLRGLAATPPTDVVDLAEVSVELPYAPTQILQSGANYRTHVVDLAVDREIGRRPGMSIEDLRAEAEAMMDARISGGEPYVFLGAASALTGPFGDVVLPERGDHDWELELAVVIGRGGRHIAAGRAFEHVAGYTICNDITTRDLVNRADMPAIGTDWLRAKNSPTFLPTGPWIVPAEFVADPAELQITLKLNGEAMQDAPTSDMMFSVARLIAYVSASVGLRAGDLLLTGSPAGNGSHFGRYLQPGDVLEGSITGLGTQVNRCRSEEKS
jgi:2-keto-4-pentenoate hydratase/2-oxohepta-3-ene-1,7-dioic acid hydratase in catechol pathway